MKILHLNQHGANVGGVEGYISNVSRALSAAGHESTLVYFQLDGPGNLLPGATKLIASASLNRQIEQLVKVCDEFEPDVAFVHAVYDPKIVRWVANRLPTTAYVHGPYLVCPGNAQYLRVSNRACPYSAGASCLLHAQTELCCFSRNPIHHLRRLCDVRSHMAIYRELAILVGSQFMKELLQRNNFPARQVDVLAPFLVEDDSSQSIPIRTHNTILFVGRIVPEKGLTYLMRALSSVRKEWRLLVAGDGEERSHCESLAEELGVSGQIRFLGWVDEHELARLYDDSSFVVVPSLWPEPFGRVGPEAATRGRAAVAFDTGGVSDWLVDGVSGYLVPPGDLGLLSERVNSLLDSHAQQVEMGQQARVLAFAKWNSIDHVNHLITHLSAAHIEDARHLVGGY